MKNLVLSLLLLAVSSVCAAIPSMNVSVAAPDGKIVFKGRTNPDGSFGIGKLQPGNYTVQFTSSDPSVKGHQYSVVVTAGKNKVTADPVPGKNLAGAGVAMKVAVASAGGNITGQVRAGAGTGSDDSKVKIVNGKRYIWVGPETGSNMGGRWVEEGSVDASKVLRGNKDGLQRIQDGAGRGTLPGS